ncbi:LPS translocon maturation chaperone LptM [Paraglaciecola sp.]|uniref:LPS translocon maturation chaperone LptM n=1 Tax=Paraglaciecola sp. TaxID=1920173 RepID=UPI003EF298FE
MRHSFKSQTLSLVLFSLVLLCSCGQKRALYLPEEPTTNQPTKETKESTESEGKN